MGANFSAISQNSRIFNKKKKMRLKHLQNGSHFVSSSQRIYYKDIIMSMMASQITNVPTVFSTVCSRCISKKTSNLHVTGLSEGNPLVTGGFPSQKASNAENISIWWSHHVIAFFIVSTPGNSLTPGRCSSEFSKCNLRTHVTYQVCEHFLWNYSQMNATEHLWW